MEERGPAQEVEMRERRKDKVNPNMKYNSSSTALNWWAVDSNRCDSRKYSMQMNSVAIWRAYIHVLTIGRWLFL